MDDVPGVPEYLTVAEFLDWTPPPGFERHRWHLMDEKPVLMPVLHVEQALLHSEAMWAISASLKHNGSDARVGAMVGVISEASECNLYVACIGVTHTRPTGNRLMPDPVLLVEIATPENRQLVGVGVCACKLVESVQEILVLDGSSVCAALHRRKEDGEWDVPLWLFSAGRLHLQSIGIEVPLERIYQSVDLGKEALVNRKKLPPHPGGIVRRSLDALGISTADAAAHLGVQRAYLSDVVSGAAGINADLAVRLAAAFGSSREDWLGMQSEHDLALVAEDATEVERLGPAVWDEHRPKLGALRETVHPDGLYDADVLEWSDHQARLLRQHAAGKAGNEAPD